MKDAYRVDEITDDTVTLTYLSLGQQQHLPAAFEVPTTVGPAVAAAPAPAPVVRGSIGPAVPTISAPTPPASGIMPLSEFETPPGVGSPLGR